MNWETLQRYIFVLLLILLPTQLGYHFWPSWAYINGIRVDYFSPTLYATDILVILLLLLEFRKSKFKSQKVKLKGKSLLICCFIGLLIFLNVYFSLSPAVSIYKWVKVAEMGFLAWWVSRRGQRLNLLSYWLLVPVVYESVLVIWQFWQQNSVGGFWYWLGERAFTGGTPGIANAYINGDLVLRPYGTFPHPNLLGGFLAVFLPVILALRLRSGQAQFLHNSRKIAAIALGLGYAALFLSMSRVAIFVGVVVTAWILRRKFWFWVVLLAGAILVWPRFTALGQETEPVVMREKLNSLAVAEFTRSPLWGTGLGTAPLYSALRQPTHNIYLLLLAETGILGLWVILFLKKTTLPLATIMFLGLFDHYFLTLQQGQLILALILGWSFARMEEVEK